jgi:hypothetical protein
MPSLICFILCFDIPQIKFVNIDEKGEKVWFFSVMKDLLHKGVSMSEHNFKLMYTCAHHL